MNYTYYYIKPLIPRFLQITLRRQFIRWKRLFVTDIWPIDESSKKAPEGWSGWPNGKQFALVLTHDVDTAKGQEKVFDIVNLEEAMGFRSSFNFVPEGYEVSHDLHHYLRAHGFEIGAHGLIHDGKLFNSRKIFQSSSPAINHYLKDWGAVGFRSPAMHHNLDWICDLNIEYDSSTFDIDPFEPQPDGLGTIFPFWVRGKANQSGYIELPYTLPQDFTLFILMKEKNIDIWKKKLDWIAEHGGMALLITHPDYMNFDGKKLGIEEYPARYYEEFLEHVKQKYEDHYLNVLPKDMARFWVNNYSNNSFSTNSKS